jgi:protein-L-isoaspartate(D-aspartate) O-methyltransferase
MEMARKRMVSAQLRDRGIHEPAILAAFDQVPRHLFVGRAYRNSAYADAPLPIPAGQTISQPYVVAYMIQTLDLRPEDKVLEIGTGSGYAAAVLSHLVRAVYTVERHPELIDFARENWARAGYKHIHILEGDGTLGWPEHAPYDGIIVAASGPTIPAALQAQLAIGGRLVMPMGERSRRQDLVLLTRESENVYRQTSKGAVRFVPLIGRQGWQGELI